jgi:hypothetical protein
VQWAGTASSSQPELKGYFVFFLAHKFGAPCAAMPCQLAVLAGDRCDEWPAAAGSRRPRRERAYGALASDAPLWRGSPGPAESAPIPGHFPRPTDLPTSPQGARNCSTGAITFMHPGPFGSLT